MFCIVLLQGSATGWCSTSGCWLLDVFEIQYPKGSKTLTLTSDKKPTTTIQTQALDG